MMLLFCGYSLGVWYGAKLIVDKGYTGAQVMNVIIALLTHYERNLQRVMLGTLALSIWHHRELFLGSIIVEGSGLPCGTVHFACNSWMQTTRELPGNSKSVFYSNKIPLCLLFSRHILPVQMLLCGIGRLDDPEGPVLFLLGICR